MKVYISPHPSQYSEDGRGSGGIWRVVNAQAKHLPHNGVEIVKDEVDADVVAIHGGALIDTDKPIVAHNHGLYWTGDFPWERGYWEHNGAVVESLRRASQITVPSEWVAYPIKRDMRKAPVVIPHGIDISKHTPRSNKGYVLWGKPRVDVVSDPTPMNNLAKIALKAQFISTFGMAAENVNVIGTHSHEEFREIMAGAAVWLATARETGDIGSREAMALGIPVLGWDWGATKDLVRHLETGYLAKPNDYGDLREGLNYCIQYQKRLGNAAREYVETHCQWKDIIPLYTDVYAKALEQNQYPAKVSVIIPAYNYAHFLPECLSSVFQQSMWDFEIIIVDDGSTDKTQEVLDLYSEFDNVTIVKQNNRGLVSALNMGHSLAKGEYVLNLDPDNMLPHDALKTLSTVLDDKPWLDVASGGLAFYSPDGNHTIAKDWPWGKIDVQQQLDHYNQLHSSSMMRRRSISRLGGYRLRQKKNEDGEYWCRAMSAGLRFEQVTDNPTLVYRFHDGNKSKTEGGEDDPDGPLAWNFYYPWRKSDNLVPFAITRPAPKGSWAVRSYDKPHIAVVIPCGPDHDKYLMDALDSVVGQTFQNYECIIGNDTGKPIDVAAMGHPWARVVDSPGKGPAAARNAAIAAAKAPLIFPLDADDLLYPNALKMFYFAWLEDMSNLVYGDCFTEDYPGHRKRYFSGPWSWGKIEKEAIYQVNILFAKSWWASVGGYDENTLWEDWIFGLKMHFMGIGATYINEPWGVYRHWTGRKSDDDAADYGTDKFLEKLNEVYELIEQKEQGMACPGCRKSAQGRKASNPGAVVMEVPSGPNQLMMYTGTRKGDFSLNSKVVPGRKYRISRNVAFEVPAGDAAWLVRMVDFKAVEARELAPQLPWEPPAPPSIEMITMAESPAPEPAPTPEPVIPTPKPAPAPSTSTPLRAQDFTGISERMIMAMRAMGINTIEDLRREFETNGVDRLSKIRSLKDKRLQSLKEVLGIE